MRNGLFAGDLDEVEFIEDVERRFGIGFDERDYPIWRTLGELARTVAVHNVMMLKAHGAGLRPGDVWESLRAIAADHTGLSADAIRPDSPFIQQKVKRYAA